MSRPWRRRYGLGLPRRIATISVHTSPLDQPGTGDAGGMNVYIVEVSRQLAEAGIEVEIFTRATSSDLPPSVEMAPGVTVRHVHAGPFEGLKKDELPAQLCAFTSGVLRAEAAHEPGYYDLIHSHYWLSGQVGWLAKDRWGVPLVHTSHTLARVKNASLAEDDIPEPRARVIGEDQVIAEADRLVANTEAERNQLIEEYKADPDKVATVTPGVDLDRFSPGDQGAARQRFGLPLDSAVLLFVGRIQPLKAPDVLLRAVAAMNSPSLTVVVCGGPSGTGLEHPEQLQELASSLGIAQQVRFIPPLPPSDLADLYRAADITVVPSYSESFGLVAVESQACGTPVVAAAVGGLTTAVADNSSGILIDGHDPLHYAEVLHRLLADPQRLAELRRYAPVHAAGFSWQRTRDELLAVYRDALSQRVIPLEQVVY